MILGISGVESRALSIGKGLEAVAALVFEFDENSSSFRDLTCHFPGTAKNFESMQMDLGDVRLT